MFRVHLRYLESYPNLYMSLQPTYKPTQTCCLCEFERPPPNSCIDFSVDTCVVLCTPVNAVLIEKSEYSVLDYLIHCTPFSDCDAYLWSLYVAEDNKETLTHVAALIVAFNLKNTTKTRNQDLHIYFTYRSGEGHSQYTHGLSRALSVSCNRS